MTYEFILFERRGGVAWLTMNRPEMRNALKPEMREEMIDAIGTVAGDLDLRCLVVTGAGEGFCSGADISGAGARQGQKRVAGMARDAIRGGSQRLFRALWELEKPTVAAVNGVAAGIGCHIAFACDLVIASEKARFIEVFARRGIVPDGGGAYILPRLVGLAKAKEMVFFADSWAAADAEKIGLVNKVVAPDELEKAATEWAERLAAGPTRALGLAKRLLNRSLESDLATSLEEEALTQELINQTDDIKEGMIAFAERRDPNFTGR
ncbi:MAG: enoyl-CoA hydratase-related protein [Actinomycetota bacterium]